MKKNLLTVSALLLATLAAPNVMAHPGHRHPPHHGGGGGDYSDGFIAGLVASTAAIFLTHTSAHQYKELVMMGADEDAAAFLASNEQPSALLQAAMQLERNVLADAGLALELSDEAVAQAIIERAASLK